MNSYRTVKVGKPAWTTPQRSGETTGGGQGVRPGAVAYNLTAQQIMDALRLTAAGGDPLVGQFDHPLHPLRGRRGHLRKRPTAWRMLDAACANMRIHRTKLSSKKTKMVVLDAQATAPSRWLGPSTWTNNNRAQDSFVYLGVELFGDIHDTDLASTPAKRRWRNARQGGHTPGRRSVTEPAGNPC
jgi:hypothetical protein